VDDVRVNDIAAGVANGAVAPEAALAALAGLARDHTVPPGLLAEIAASVAEMEGRLGPAATQAAFVRGLLRDRQKHGAGGGGAVATSSPDAASAGARVLAEGGNAIDAACTAALALTVTDPANAGIAGRCHVVIHARGRAPIVIDAATQAPAVLRGPGKAGEITSVPIPGMLAGLAVAAAAGASRPWPDLVGPAIALAEDGFAVPPGLAAVWTVNRDRLARHAHTARAFLKPDGSPYAAGERFRQPALAAVLRRVAAGGPRALYEGEIAHDIAAQMAEEGGSVRAADLAEYTARRGEAVEGRFGPYSFTVPGRQAWGHSLVETLQVADRFEFSTAVCTPEEAETLALTILVAFDDRPERLGSLDPKANALPHEVLADAAFAADRAKHVEDLLHGGGAARDAEVARLVAGTAHAPQGDTTHLSVFDRDGTAVALTCSLGPHFGSTVTAGRHGFLYAHSYRMIARPAPDARDVTEMCPSVFVSGGRPVLATGGAGSERIPCAVMLTAVNILARRWPALEAVAAPRFAWTDARLRVHCDLSASVRDHLAQRGLPLQLIGRGYVNHAGVAHLVAAGVDGRCESVADPAYDGIGAAVQA
jgi:gamma-glutamyltranspeptidase/glutathione hydrolase